MGLTPFADIPGPIPFQGAVIPALSADAASVAYPVFRVPFNCKLTKVSLIPQGSVSGHASNRKNLNVINKGANGIGTVELANLDLVAGVDLTAFDEKPIYAPADPNSGINLTAGDVIALEVEDVGTSPAFPQLQTYIEIIAR